MVGGTYTYYIALHIQALRSVLKEICKQFAPFVYARARVQQPSSLIATALIALLNLVPYRFHTKGISETSHTDYPLFSDTLQSIIVIEFIFTGFCIKTNVLYRTAFCKH